MAKKNSNVLLYVPNLIGYFRLLLIGLAFLGYEYPAWFVPLYTVSVLLDGLDGYAARKLNQCSEFGAWLDVVVDLLSRGLLWCSLSQTGYLVMMVEWLTFTSTHCKGAKWKIPEDSFPWLVTRVMAEGFKTWWGAAAIGGLHFLPLWVYMMDSDVLCAVMVPLWVQWSCLIGLIVGRLLCMYVEVFYIYSHVAKLIESNTVREER